MRHDYTHLRDALVELRDLACIGKVPDDMFGICYNVFIILGEDLCTFDFRFENTSSWEYFDYSFAYPVPETKHMWKGRGLELRLSIINHWINRIDNPRLTGEFTSPR